jgi:hypothetical protein
MAVDKGERQYFGTRVPSDVANAFLAEVAADGRGISDFLADMLADRYNLKPVSDRFPTKAERKARNQGVLPLQAVS